MFKNDERYWDINLLNKWFAVSSIIFLVVTVWVFVDDNDDEFKTYQKEFRKMQVELAEKKLIQDSTSIAAEKVIYEEELALAQESFNNRKDELGLLEEELRTLKNRHYNENMLYQGQKAKIDELKYLVELDNAQGASNGPSYIDDYNNELDKLDNLRLIRENTEIEISEKEQLIKELKSQVKLKKDELDAFTRQYTLTKNTLNKIDRDRMSIGNKIGDIVRDLPILDFLDPYYKVHQIVVADIKYDVNFAAVPTVDRCTSCHLGIDNPDFSDAPQPYTTHPNLDLYLTSASPHPINNFGCTSCHAGKSRGTSFVSSQHTPNTPEDKERWKEEYDWKKDHHWLTPMLPTRYTQASCFNCHSNTSDLAGAEKLNFGLSLVDKAGCNGCHHNEDWPTQAKSGPNLKKVNEKLSEDWVSKWVKNPRHFRYNTRMPAIFEQPNQETAEITAYNDAEIAGITEYLFNGKNKQSGSNSKRFIGDYTNGEKLFNAVGCTGCHVSENNPELAPHVNSYYNLTKVQGPNLIGMGSKVSAEWLYEWLMDPQAYNPETMMPNLRLEPQQAKDLTAYLIKDKNEPFDALPDHNYNKEVLDQLTVNWLKKSNPEKYAIQKASKMNEEEKLNFVGEKSIRHYGCFGCHNIDGFDDAKPIGVEITEEGSKPVKKFDFGLFHDIEHTTHAWIENKLRTPRIYDRGKESEHLDLLKMPNFYFSEEEIEAITTAVLSFNANKIGEKLLAHKKAPDIYKKGHRLVKQYNCQGCHLIENKGGQIVDLIGKPEYAPPNLHTEGKKANPDWLLSFLNNPSIIRPNLQVKMPSYHQISDEDWDAIIAYFQHMADEKIHYRSKHQFDTESTEFAAGQMLHEIGQCNSCHFYGEEFPTGDAPTWAPNLALTKERLNPEWVHEWLKNPQEIMPGTKMPAPYLPDENVLSADGAVNDWGRELVELNGDTTAMLDGLTDYLWNIKGSTNIDAIIKDYFDKNGYDFESTSNDEDEYDEDDDWGDDEYDEDDDW
jgi:cbb3-type cytochrome oxidase cytochrome c subunit